MLGTYFQCLPAVIRIREISAGVPTKEPIPPAVSAETNNNYDNYNNMIYGRYCS